MQKGLVSVIMSVYNAEKFLNVCIDSILNQTYRNFEFIIIDDCSTDSTSTILESYRILDSRIIIVRNSKNRGLTYSLNMAIRMALGEYIARMDADDIAFPKRLEKQIGFLENHSAIDICGTACIEIDGDGNELFHKSMPMNNREIEFIIFKMNPFIHSTVMVRNVFFNKVGLYNETYVKSQDLELWARAYVAGIKMANLSDFLLYYRMSKDFWGKRSSAIVIRNEIRVIHFLIKHTGKYHKYITVLVPKVLFRIFLRVMPSKLNQKLYNYLRS